MSNLAIRPSADGDFDFCWSVYQKTTDRDKASFGAMWKSRSNCVVEIDGKRVGWFACVVDSVNKNVSIEDMSFGPGLPGVSHLVLSIIAKDTANRGRRALWSLPKSHPAVAVFKSKAFPLHSETDSHATIELSTFLERADAWGAAGNPNLPWNKA